MSLRDDILGAVAANLREFGYPDCTPDTVLTTKVFAMFAKSQLQDFMDDCGRAEVTEVVQPMLDQIAKLEEEG